MDNENSDKTAVSTTDWSKVGNGNLKPWPKGVSGNPKGKKKGTKHGLRATVNRILRRNAPEQWQVALRMKGLSIKDPKISDMITLSMVREAIEGDNPVSAAKLLFDQTEKPLKDEATQQPVIINVVAPTACEAIEYQDAIPVEGRPLIDDTSTD